MLSSAVKKYAEFYGVACGEKIFSLQITIVHMKVYYAYTIKELKLKQLLILEMNSEFKNC